MRRRQFIAGLAGTAAWPLAARAQKAERVRRIGVMFSSPEDSLYVQSTLPPFRNALERFGWREGETLSIDYKWNRSPTTLSERARELVKLAPEVIFVGSASSLVPMQAATQAIPIVFANVPDPIGNGFVKSLARPGGNTTGFANYEEGVGGKWVELLVQLAPHTKRVAVIYDPANPGTRGYLRAAEKVGSSTGVNVAGVTIGSADEIARAMADFAQEPNGGVVVPPGPTTATYAALISSLAMRHRIPAVFSFGDYVRHGALASYGVDPSELFLKAASYVDRILKGERPGDLPILYATKFHLAINLKTAKALNLDIPIALLARTDETVE